MRITERIEKKTGAASGTLFAVFVAFAVKAIGALYKIPLYNLLGDVATGLYGMIFPLFAFLLTLSGSGVPSALTKMISGGYGAEKVLKKTLLLFCPVGVVLSAGLFIFADKIAFLQGDVNAAPLYRAISPSVFVVGAVAAFRGYFQGQSNMRVTAVSQFLEQALRAAIGLIGAYFLPVSQNEKALFAVCSISVSELVALIYCYARYVRTVKKGTSSLNTDIKNPTAGELLSCILPLTVSSLIIPLSAVAEGFIVVRALRGLFGETGTAYYGLYSGAVEIMVSLPAAVLYPVAMGFLPRMKSDERVEKRALAITFFGAIAAGAFTFIFPMTIVKILFSGLTYKNLLIKMLRASALTMTLLPVLQTLSVVMLAKDGQHRLLLHNAIGAAIKVALCALLAGLPEVNVFAPIISDICCYFVALLLHLIYISRYNKSVGAIKGWNGDNDNVGGTGNGKRRIVVESVQGN